MAFKEEFDFILVCMCLFSFVKPSLLTTSICIELATQGMRVETSAPRSSVQLSSVETSSAEPN